MRWAQLKEGAQRWFSSPGGSTHPLFLANAVQLGLELAGDFEADPEIGETLSLWNYIATGVLLERIGRRTKMCEYSSWLKMGSVRLEALYVPENDL